jgi:Universal stress protein family
MVRTSPLSVTDVRLDGGVVVGDDGSPAAEAAIRYALEEAKRRDSVLHVVRAWTILTRSIRLIRPSVMSRLCTSWRPRR